MMQQLRAFTERVNASAARVVVAAFAQLGLAPTGTSTTIWNAMPSVQPTAIGTDGKCYAWRLREMPT